MPDKDRLNPVQDLFDEMSATYGIVNLISSLGFTFFWRRACGRAADSRCRRVLDVMSGSGEMVPHLAARVGCGASIVLVDFSDGMTARAEANARRWNRAGLVVRKEDALSMSAEDEEFDCVTCSFGLKTLTGPELERFAGEVFRVTKPGGRISLVEISVPQHRLLWIFFRFYVRDLVPLIGAAFMGNPDNYRLLWHYTSQFKDCRAAAQTFEAAGFQTQMRRLFFGCATQIVGQRPSGSRCDAAP